ncbi:hypothetical protein CDL15_Pgr021538 [Punica granatum]|uniref:Uncharacterized protein n=1 Tax=Punica granatum TaxID=22663 RepID=A0A218XPN5_PUNGR|nr:hypothetical protein CDL15_Pgr021538 [Punica granatum]
MIQLEDPSHGHVEAFQDDGSSGQYSLSLKPSLDDPWFDLILLLLGLATGLSRFASFGIRALAPIQLLDGYDETSSSSCSKLKWGYLTKKEEKIALKPIKKKPTNKFQPNSKENGHIASQFLDSDGRNATLLLLPPNQMEEEQLQIKRPIDGKSEEFKNVFLEQMPTEKSPIKLVVIDSRTNLFEKRGNDMIQLEDPSHGHVEAFQDDGVWHEVEH